MKNKNSRKNLYIPPCTINFGEKIDIQHIFSETGRTASKASVFVWDEKKPEKKAKRGEAKKEEAKQEKKEEKKPAEEKKEEAKQEEKKE